MPRRRNPPLLEARRHGIVLAAPLGRAVVLSAGGGLAVAVGWPATLAGALALALGALVGLRAVWRWERTRIVVTPGELAVVDGTVRRRSAAVPLERVGAVEVEQSLLGRLLGYGTIVAGDLEIDYVARPGELAAALR
jgi:membrane protein YdbS with pleckstrin-like domain